MPMSLLERTKKHSYDFYEKLAAMDTPWSKDFYNFEKIVEYKINNCCVLIKKSNALVWTITIVIKNESIKNYIQKNKRNFIRKMRGFYCFKFFRKDFDDYLLRFAFDEYRDIVPSCFISKCEECGNAPDATYKDLEYAKKCSEDILFFIFNHLESF